MSERFPTGAYVYRVCDKDLLPHEKNLGQIREYKNGKYKVKFAGIERLQSHTHEELWHQNHLDSDPNPPSVD